MGRQDKSRRAQTPEQVLAGERTGIGALLMHAREIDRLNTQLAAVLEPGTGALVQVASIRYDTVVLVTPSAALATRLKLDPAPLLAHLSHKSGRSFSKLEVRVAPLPGNKPADTRKRRQVPVQARAVFERFRSSDDPKEG